ncbi:unnamed protein product [Owenia fusiformis]|uniref:DUF7107 domain-containing protein n=1 Tax=Owenia fusiformis TaxID=6347 RepID=A0A8J1TWZ9_OWEFU|nr:unnamed protein product [Owenia fusiformis]
MRFCSIHILLTLTLIGPALAQPEERVECRPGRTACHAFDKRCCGCKRRLQVFKVGVFHKEMYPLQAINLGYCLDAPCLYSKCKRHVDAKRAELNELELNQADELDNDIAVAGPGNALGDAIPQCRGDDQCETTQYCAENGQCHSKLPYSSACTNNKECSSGHCVDVCVECEQQTDCGDNYLCTQNTCVAKKLFGDACSQDMACQSGLVCNKGVCSRCADELDCSDTQYCKGDSKVGYSCRPKENVGVKCEESLECNSGHCVGVCVECEQQSDCEDDYQCKGNTCVNRKPFGGSCNNDKDCLSEYVCNEGACSTCSEERTCGGNEYCKGDPTTGYRCSSKEEIGDICNTPSECSSGHCVGVCVECEQKTDCEDDYLCKENTCVQRKLFGGSCSENKDCLSDFVCYEGACSTCSEELTCEDNEYCKGDSTSGYSCSSKEDVGSVCDYPSECSSGHCVDVCVECEKQTDCGDEYLCEGNTCVQRKSFGGSCSEDKDCLSEFVCSDNVCSSCSKEPNTCEDNEYCKGDPTTGYSCSSKEDIGAICNTPSECSSGHCVGVCVECEQQTDCGDDYLCKENTCVQRKLFGGPCSENKDCLLELVCNEGACSTCSEERTCEDNEYCKGDSTSGYSCSSKEEIGAVCDHTSECSSGHCVGVCVECEKQTDCGDEYLCEGNTCVQRKSFGGSCSEDKDCLSEFVCSDNVCSSCSKEPNTCEDNEYCKGDPTTGYRCSSKEEIGDICNTPSECSSGHCVGVCVQCEQQTDCGDDYLCKENTCVQRKLFGGPCSENKDCLLEFVCNEGACSTCSEERTCEDNEYCKGDSTSGYSCSSKEEIGAVCDHTSECSSGHCVGVCVECEKQTDCGDEYLCKENTCFQKNHFGGSCSEDKDCRSDLVCNEGVCSTCTREPSSCTAEHYCKGDSKDGFRCSPKEYFGAKCDDSLACASGHCGDGDLCVDCEERSDCENGELCTDNTCVPRMVFGDPCEEDDECEVDLVCNTGVCSRCRDDMGCTEQQYCKAGDPNSIEGTSGFECSAKEDIDSPCLDASNCLKGHCVKNMCVACEEDSDCDNELCKSNTCVGKPVFGESCEAEDECVAGLKCNKGVCSLCDSDSDCTLEEYCKRPVGEMGYYCAIKENVGTICNADTECNTGHCVGEEYSELRCVDCREDADCVGGLCKDHTCVSRQGFGGYCSSNDNCELDLVCNEHRCSRCMSADDCMVDEYCKGDSTSGYTCSERETIGSECSEHSQCGSGMCYNSLCGTCLEDGDCNSSEYCQNDDPSKPNNCVRKREVDETCASSRECTSGYCRGSQSISIVGTCKTLLPLERPCTKDDECASNVCIGKCVQCKTKPDCPPGKACWTDTYKCKPEGRKYERCNQHDHCKKKFICKNGRCNI